MLHALQKILQHSLLALLALLLMLLPFGTAHAAGAEKIVRVGWFGETFFSLSANGMRSGYAYDYLQKIANYTNWKYEYVEGSWTQLRELLQRGEIDILADVSYTPERAEQLLFSSRPMGEEEYYAYISSENRDITAEDLRSLNGRRVGVNKGSRQAQLFRDWAVRHGLTTEIVSLECSEQEAMDRLLRGELEVLVTLDFSKGDNPVIPLVKLGSAPIYFAVNKSRSDLLTELDYALEAVHNEDRYYEQSLSNKYLRPLGSAIRLSDWEKSWLRGHGPVKIGYRDNYLPFSGTDKATGNPAGLLPDYVKLATQRLENAQIDFQLVAYPNTEQAIAAMQRGEVDCVFPVNLNPSEAEQKGVSMGTPVTRASMSFLVAKSRIREFDPTGKMRIAVNAGNASYLNVVAMNYPNFQVVTFKNTEEGLRGIARGEADCLLLSVYRLPAFEGLCEELDLAVLNAGIYTDMSFATDRSQLLLYGLLNKLTGGIPQPLLENSVIVHSQQEKAVGLKDVLRAHALKITWLVAGVVGLLMVLLLRSRHAEQTAREALQREEQANQAKTVFLNNMSHDIRTPMNAILGFARIMKKSPDNPEVILSSLAKLESSGKYLLGVINNVLDISRIESGHAVLDEEPYDILDGERGLAIGFEEAVAQKKLHYTIDYRIKNRYIYVDKAAAQKIAVNIVGNAIKYTPEKGSVAVSMVEQPSSRPGYGTYVFTVTDTGIGMSEEFQRHMFELFSRERNTTESKVIGTGLGMAIVKRTVELMGGTLEVESRQGVGTTFRVTLEHRLAEAPLERAELPQEPLAGEQLQRRVLLTEDNELNAEIAKEILEDKGFLVELAEHGQACLELLEKNPPGYFDVILMDIQMPVLDGYGATAKIRQLADRAKADIPILAMTANAFEEDRRRALDAGMNGFCTKPIDMVQLSRELARVLDGK